MNRPYLKHAAPHAYFGIFCLSLCSLWIGAISAGYAKDSWFISEFLINYRGGFVRRGLIGEVLLCFYEMTGVSPYYIIIFGSAALYVLFVAVYLGLFIRKGYPIFILPCSFFLGGPILGEFWARKDVALVLLFMGVVRLVTRPTRGHVILANLLFVLGILSHEAIGFFGLPITFLILCSNQRLNVEGKRSAAITRLLKSFLQLMPTIAVFGLVLFFGGTQETANKIWDSWRLVPFPGGEIADIQPPAAIDALAWPLRRALSLAMQTLHNFRDGIYAPLAWSLILCVVYYILINTNKFKLSGLGYKPLKAFTKEDISNVLLFQLASILPLFVLGWDYGRWVFFWVTSSFAVILLMPESRVQQLFPAALRSISARIVGISECFKDESRTFLIIACMLIGVPAVSWSLNAYMDTVSLVVVIRFLSSIIYNILFAG